MTVVILQSIGLKEGRYLNCEPSCHMIIRALMSNFSYYGLHWKPAMAVLRVRVNTYLAPLKVLFWHKSLLLAEWTSI